MVSHTWGLIMARSFHFTPASFSNDSKQTLFLIFSLYFKLCWRGAKLVRNISSVLKRSCFCWCFLIIYFIYIYFSIGLNCTPESCEEQQQSLRHQLKWLGASNHNMSKSYFASSYTYEFSSFYNLVWWSIGELIKRTFHIKWLFCFRWEYRSSSRILILYIYFKYRFKLFWPIFTESSYYSYTDFLASTISFDDR